MNTFCFGRIALIVNAATLLSACAGSSLPKGGPGSVAAGGQAPKGAKTFQYTGGEQTFVVPKGVRHIGVVARGAAGAGSTYRSYGPPNFGRGGRVHATLPVRPGETIYVFVGGKGDVPTGGFNGGGNGGPSNTCGHNYGGGGASDVRQGGDDPSDRVLIAGGGGGGGGVQQVIAGPGGGKIGGHGGSGHHSFFGAGGGGGGAGAPKAKAAPAATAALTAGQVGVGARAERWPLGVMAAHAAFLPPFSQAAVAAVAITAAAEAAVAALPRTVAAAAVDRPTSNRSRSNHACGKAGKTQRATA